MYIFSMVSEENFDHDLPLYYTLLFIISLVKKMLIFPTGNAKHLEGTA